MFIAKLIKKQRSVPKNYYKFALKYDLWMQNN